MKVSEKIIKGIRYYYFEETLRFEKPKRYSIYIGRKLPKNLEELKTRLTSKIYLDLIGNKTHINLSKEELIECEKKRRQFEFKLKKMGKARLDEKEEIDTVNFVYTTLTTEGIPITKEDAKLAYHFEAKEVKDIRDENLRISLDMIKGLRYVKESKAGISHEFITTLHGIIMPQYADKNPGKIRDKQAYIYLKSFEKVEEIKFRPPAPKELRDKLEEFVKWYNENLIALNPVEFAALAHVKFYAIHPFEDGNKRTSRLLLNKALFDCSYPLLNISKDTAKYFNALIAYVEKKDEKTFAKLVLEKLLETFKTKL